MRSWLYLCIYIYYVQNTCFHTWYRFGMNLLSKKSASVCRWYGIKIGISTYIFNLWRTLNTYMKSFWIHMEVQYHNFTTSWVIMNYLRGIRFDFWNNLSIYCIIRKHVSSKKRVHLLLFLFPGYITCEITVSERLIFFH